jgi:hypothetical protein
VPTHRVRQLADIDQIDRRRFNKKRLPLAQAVLQKLDPRLETPLAELPKNLRLRTLASLPQVAERAIALPFPDSERRIGPRINVDIHIELELLDRLRREAFHRCETSTRTHPDTKTRIAPW